MGLCKCPKRKVTNQFCFEHRVNVCEYCLTSNHTKCVVKSYLHWLQDSDFNPICNLCGEALANGECIRLTCYDVFHWDCVNNNALKISPNAPSSALACHICQTPILPPDKLVSPVADVVRQKLSTVGWGRKRLGLPLQIAVTQKPDPAPVTKASDTSLAEEKRNNESFSSMTNASSNGTSSNKALSSDDFFHKPQDTVAPAASPSSVSQNTHVREKFQNEVASSGKVFDTRREEKVDLYFDHDEDKYRRKGFRHWLSKMNGLRSKAKYARDDPNITFKRVAILILLIVLGFMTVILILTRVGRSVANTDRFLDPRANPNIRVNDMNHAS